MGMFDTIYVDDNLLLKWNNDLFKDDPIPPNVGWQTKNLDCLMEEYVLKETEKGIKLFVLDPPEENGPYWKLYTDQEIEEFNKQYTSGFRWTKLEKGDGHITKEGWLVKNRNHRDMGEWPHQIIYIYKDHNDRWIDLIIKFTDGYLVSIKKEEKER